MAQLQLIGDNEVWLIANVLHNEYILLFVQKSGVAAAGAPRFVRLLRTELSSQNSGVQSEV